MNTASRRNERSSSFDIRDEELRDLSSQILPLVEDYLAGVSEYPVFPYETAIHKITQLGTTPLPLEGETVEQLVHDCRTIFDASRHNGHPRFFGYIASPSTPIGAFADLIASVLNSNVTSWRSAPAATVIEKNVVRWLATLVGYGDNAHGLLVSGGSMANLTALLIAHRARSQNEVARAGLWNAGAPMIVYASEQVHLSIPKAADVLGLGRNQVRLIACDERFRLEVRDLRERLQNDLREGLRPFCVVANAGTVNTGAIDPLEEIGRIAEEFGLWFHVDGAYGALAALEPAKRPFFQGLERADSVALDPHKWLYAPIDCGCLLLRDEAHTRHAFAAGEADYIKVHEKRADESFAFWDYGLELSRRFRALKIWLMLRYYGTRCVTEAITRDCALAEYLSELINDAEDFELLAPVELSICCFRYVPSQLREKLRSTSQDRERTRINEELDELNAAVMHAVQRGGRAYLSNVTLRGCYGLRACITNFRTTRDDLRQTLEIVREAAHTMRK